MPYINPVLRELAYSLALLPCAMCSAPGPHPTRATRAEGWVALCAGCTEFLQSKALKDAGQDGGDRLHAGTLTAPLAPAY